MPITIQDMVRSLIPDILGVNRDEFLATNDPAFQGEEGSFNNFRVVNHINFANKEIARLSAIRDAHFLDTEYFFLVPPEFADYEFTVLFPSNCLIPIALDHIENNTSGARGRILQRIYTRDIANDPFYENDTYSQSRYRIQNDKMVLFGARSGLYRLTYMRSPGDLFYGDVDRLLTDLINPGLQPPAPTRFIHVVNVIGIPSRLPDSYTGDPVIVFNENTNEYQVRRVVSWYNQGNIFELDEDIYSLSGSGWKFSCASFLRDADQSLLAYLAASRFSAELPERASIARDIYSQQLAEFLDTIRPLDNATPHKVSQRDGGFRFARGFANYGRRRD